MFADYHWAYLMGDFVVGFPLWAVLFYIRKDLRKEMLVAGVLLGMLGIASEHWFLRDYWHPENLDLVRISLGDFFYGLFLGGIASVIYEVVWRKQTKKPKNRKHRWSLFFPSFAGLSFVTLDVPFHFGINSIYAAIATLFLVSAIMIYLRRDLLWDAVASSLLFGIITFVAYLIFLHMVPGIIGAWWNLSNISGILVFGIPIEEILFALAAGMAVGPAYEFFAGLEFKKSRNSFF